MTARFRLFFSAWHFSLLIFSGSALSQVGPLLEFRDAGTGKLDRVFRKTTDSATVVLEADLLSARRRGDDHSARRLQNQLERMGATPYSVATVTDVTPLGRTPTRTERPPSWGDDITVYQGVLRFAPGTNRELAAAADTLGNVYTAGILAEADSGSRIAVFKSTDVGFTWSLVNGVQIPSLRNQSFALSVTDTADGRWVVGLLYILKPSSASPGGSLMWTSFLDDGSGWRTSTLIPADSLTQYRSPTIATDGYAYSPASTWHYAAAERVVPATGVSRGITAFRSSDFGTTWPVRDTTFSFGVEDAFPTIAVQAGVGAGDTVFVAFARKFSAADNDIRLFKNSTTYSGTWTFRAVTTTLSDEFAPSLAVSTFDGSSLITYTRNTGPSTQLDALCAYTTDRWATLFTGTLASDPAKQEYLTNSAYSRTGLENQWHVSYRVVSDTATATPDTIMYTTGPDLSGIVNAVPVVVNRFQDTGALRPAVGAHRQDPTGAWVGHVAFSTPGPTNILYDGFEIPVSVNPPFALPRVFSLGQNYPNPFNPTTTINFQIPGSSPVTLTVFDILGRTVTTLVHDERTAGSYEMTFDASTLAGGIYFYRLTAGPQSVVRRMILLK